MAADIAATSASLGRDLHGETTRQLAHLIGEMDSQFSERINGLGPRLAAAYPGTRTEIDRLGTAGQLPDPASASFVNWVRQELYGTAAPAPLPDRTERLDYFARRYASAGVGRAGRIVAVATAHHRFHALDAFPGETGRIGHLLTHGMVWSADFAGRGLWSLSRALAGGRDHPGSGDYRRMMTLADTPRQGDMDGRGTLSQRALVEFTAWFLRVALEEMSSMAELLDRRSLAGRMRDVVARDRTLKPGSAALLEETFVRGEVERGEAPRITGLPERTARRVLGDLVDRGFLASATPKGPVSLRFPPDSLGVLLPALYPSA